MEKIKKEKNSYVFSSRSFEGFCRDNNITKEEGRKALFTELERLLKEKARRDLGEK